MNNLVKITTDDGLELNGFFSDGSKDKPAIMYVHGMFGDFKTPNFVNNLEEELLKNNFAYLATNNRGEGENSRHELLEEAHLDITACVQFLIDNGYNKIILIGHSAGTVKSIRYLFEGKYKDNIDKLILIAPIDPLGGRIANGRNNIDEFLIKAQEKVDEGNGNEMITSEFDHDDVSYKTFISWYKRDDLGRMFEFCNRNYEFPILNKINIPVKAIVGTKDKYLHPSNPEHPEEAMNILSKHIKEFDHKIIEGSGHNFNGFENELVQEIVNFI
jgi:pimeloyl-ACP methyl ester carboxylesterase